ncbi:beta-N-acetylhexosaminidase [Streptomyces sp. NPDC004609]|uniref:beta-N-acetylhexosaminidase n=1 Tax=Streptomyces sp. NPDC004609 TaxID=3364704 RepID=UPI0036C6923C
MLLLVAGAGAGCFAGDGGGPRPGSGGPSPGAVHALGRVVPAPASVKPGGTPYTLTAEAAIRVDDSPEVRRIGDYLAGILRPSTGYPLPVTPGPGADGIQLRLRPSESALGEEGYRLESSGGTLTVTAREPAGLFHGVQTLRQLLPAAVEKRTAQTGPWTVPGGTITDTPRYAYRGAMLDVARHFFTVDQVKRYIDQLAVYKINTFHLHLTDDQGWRIAVDSRPALATVGGSTAVGGGPGGHYTKAQYREIVAHAASRYMEVVPEIDLPGHTAAALASYAELNCDGKARPLYTGVDVGFSSLCVDKPATYDFVDDVIREIAAITPGRYLHIGGDEADSTDPGDYAAFMAKAQAAVGRYGKTVIGWHQIAGADLVKGAVAQYWGTDTTDSGEREEVAAAVKKGARLILSPADRTYLDMKYDSGTQLGLDWAGLVGVDRSYDWDPSAYLADAGVPGDAVLGVEAPLWSETLTTSAQLEWMAFPRLLGVAEKGWSRAGSWEEYAVRLAEQGPRLEARGVAYHRSPKVRWPE